MRVPRCDRFERVAWVRKRPSRLNGRYRLTRSNAMKRRGVDQRLIHDVIALRKQGRTQMEIAVEVGIAQGTVSIILRAHGWGGYLVQKQRRAGFYDR